jgi:hypothetical protein
LGTDCQACKSGTPDKAAGQQAELTEKGKSPEMSGFRICGTESAI